MGEISTDDIECFSDYMALQIPKGHVHGLKQWLGRTLHVPGKGGDCYHFEQDPESDLPKVIQAVSSRGNVLIQVCPPPLLVNWGSVERLNSFLARCGYFLYPDSAGNHIFQARYTACFVQQERANYLLEIRILQEGIKSFGQSDRYILKCPVTTSRLSQESVLCGPDTIQVSRPIPQGSASGQRPWLLSLRGELVASLEDASLLGLYVETNTTTITILGSRQQLLQRKEVMNTSVDFLSLWMVSGYYAYSLEAMCPLVSSQPGPEVLVQIPKQGLGLVKRRSRYTEALTLRDLRVSQSNSFTITENRDFVVVSIPASDVLQSQCQEAQGVTRMQPFYRIDLSLEFAEVTGPIHWTVENFFHCAAFKDQPSSSGVTDPESFSAEVSPSINKHVKAYYVPGTEELKSDLPLPLTTLNTVPSLQPSSPSLPPSIPVGMQLTSSFSLQAAGSPSSEDLQREPLGSFALDSRHHGQAVGTSPMTRLQLSIFSNSLEECSESARSRSPSGLGCLTPSNLTAPSNSSSPILRASTSAIVSFQENQSTGATLTTPLPGLWLHSLASNHDKRTPSGIPMTVPPNGGSSESEKPPEATEKIPKDTSQAVVPELSAADQRGQALLQMSSTLAAGWDDSPRRHPGPRETTALLSKNFSGSIIHLLLSFTTSSSKKKQELIMKPQAVSVGIGGDSIISSVPGAVMNQQGIKDPTSEGTAWLPTSVMFWDDSTPPSVTPGANSQAFQQTLPAPTGQIFSLPALPQLVSFGSTKYLRSPVHLLKAFITQTDGLREMRPGQDLAELPEHSNQLRRLMRGSRTKTDVNPPEGEWLD
uniref:Uncharacterized protein C1orf127 homolog n=1 Tax=Phascolarctos cinereus TaxID=38626 RepID=A0A6P5JLV1_PHACI|nr:uncharacterized protein C1orf127 homolog [Phascolarctos cinereus]